MYLGVGSPEGCYEQSPGFRLTARGGLRIWNYSCSKFLYVRVLWDLFTAFHFFSCSSAVQNMRSARNANHFAQLRNINQIGLLVTRNLFFQALKWQNFMITDIENLSVY
jgi:hypothetical protein